MSLTKVAALQMVSTNILEDNLKVAATLIAEAGAAGAQLVVLPETFAMFSTKQQLPLGRQEASAGAIVRPFIAEQAKKNKLWIVAGSIPVAADQSEIAVQDRVLSACFVVNDCGEECGRYDKIHLFDAQVEDQQGSYRESDTFAAGNEVVIVDTPVGRLGLAICYDIRFPELFRIMFERGVDLIAIPAAFTLLTGKAHWLPLLRARAIENQCYIVGANQGGEHSKSRSTSGGSVIIDGWGKVLAEAGMGERCIVAEVDLAALNKQRKAMPVASHQRFTTFVK